MRESREGKIGRPVPLIVWERSSDGQAAAGAPRNPAAEAVVPFTAPQRERAQTREETVTGWTVVTGAGRPPVQVRMVTSGFGRMVRTPSSFSPRSCAA
jgi:hypothetical protein